MSFPATPDPPHPTPLPASKSDVSDFDQSLNARTREHPGSGGERENATAGSQCVDGERENAASSTERPAEPAEPASREANSDHLSPVGREPAPDLIRGRPSAARAGEGGPNHPSSSVPPHPTPLPDGERENAAVSTERLAEPAARATNTEIESSALYRLMAWLSPAYPVGAFSYSGGLEWAVEAGDVTNTDALAAWLAVLIGEGGGFCDAVLFAHAHRAAAKRDDEALRAVAELAAAFAPSKERHLETSAQGGAFLEVTRAAWPCAALDRLAQAWPGPYAYPVVVATAAAGHGIAVEPALAAYLHAVAANLVSAGVRLIPLGQTDGQRVIAALEPLIGATARRALTTPLDAMGAAAFRADLASQRHETQYTRLFRS
jgi:urease accessory protein